MSFILEHAGQIDVFLFLANMAALFAVGLVGNRLYG